MYVACYINSYNYIRGAIFQRSAHQQTRILQGNMTKTMTNCVSKNVHERTLFISQMIPHARTHACLCVYMFGLYVYSN